MNRTPWVHDLLYITERVRLTRDEFCAKYFPRYVEPYFAGHGRPKGNGRWSSPTAATAKGQNTKRARIVDEAFAHYCAIFDSCEQFDHNSPATNTET